MVSLRRTLRDGSSSPRQAHDVDTEQTPPLRSAVLNRQQAFAYTQEDIKIIMEPIAANGEEPIGSMGNDSPLAVLSSKNKTLSHYFKQLFAQVTNPAIDPIREELVTSLVSFIGPKPNLLGIDEMNPPLRLEGVSQPVLDFYEMEKIRLDIDRYTGGKFRVDRARYHLSRRLGQRGDRGAPGVARCASRRRGARRQLDHRHLRSQGRPRAGRHSGAARVVGDSSASRRPRPAHQHRPRGRNGERARSASLCASRRLRRRGRAPLSGARDAARDDEDRAAGSKATKNFVMAIGKGLKKVMSKMGISTYMSYTGSQCFEAIGLAKSLTEKYFNDSSSASWIRP